MLSTAAFGLFSIAYLIVIAVFILGNRLVAFWDRCEESKRPNWDEEEKDA